MLIIGTIALVQYAGERRRNYREIPYSEFVQELEQRNIAAIQVTSRRVRGDLTTPGRAGSESSNHFVTTLPFEPSDAWVATLVEKGVEVRGEEARGQRSWPVVVLTFLPYLLMLFVVILVLRHLQARRREGGS